MVGLLLDCGAKRESVGHRSESVEKVVRMDLREEIERTLAL